MLFRVLRAGVLAALLGLVDLGIAQAAQLLVVASQTPALKPGTIIDSAKVLQLAAGESATLVSGLGHTLRLAGPHSAPPAVPPTPEGATPDTALLSALQGLIDEVNAANRAEQAAKPGDEAAEGLLQRPWLINAARQGHVCLRRDLPARLWRPTSSRAETMAITGPSGKPVRVDWPAGEAILGWPAGVALAEAGDYRVQMQGSTKMQRIVLHFVPDDLPTDPHRIRWLLDQGCRDQARALLGTLK